MFRCLGKVTILAVLLSLLAAPQNHGVAANVIFKRGYVDSPHGQTHFYLAQPSEDISSTAPLVFFHQTPSSGLEFKPLLIEMGRDRLVYAMDMPGYGGSDRPPEPPTMADIALSMAVALDNLGYGANGSGPVDVFGFHTGVFVASELALLRPDLVRRIVMSGVGFFSPEERKVRFDRLPRDQKLHESGSDVLRMWHWHINRRGQGISLDRAFEQFVAQISSVGTAWYAYHGVWSYPIEERFALLDQNKILILQPDEVLLERSRRAHKELLPNAKMIEFLVSKSPCSTTAQPNMDGTCARGWKPTNNSLRYSC